MTPPVPSGEIKIAWGKKMSPALKSRCIIMARDFDLDPNWVPACMWFESKINPKAKNPNSSATGLIQFMRKTALELGTTVEELYNMSAEKQFDYVWLYFRDRIKERGPIRSLADCYMAILNPSMIGKPESTVMWVKGTQAYAVNAGLDANKDHQITKAEAAAKAQAALVAGLREENFG